MTLWILEPRDPLVFRDGRAFDAVPGARAVSLSFPFPSTIAGAVRTREGLDHDGRFQAEKIPHVKRIGIRGPLLVQLHRETQEIERFLVQAPRDAQILESGSTQETEGKLKVLLPLDVGPHARSCLPKGLSFVGMPSPDLSKLHKHAPAFWYWEAFAKWLLEPREGSITLGELGHRGPTTESRFHVGIHPETKAAHVEEGALFQTSGLDFVTAINGSKAEGLRKLGLAVDTEALNLRNGLGFLGGERRLVIWRKSERALPVCPLSLKEHIVKHRHCRLILLTPAHFRKGWHPTWLLNSHEGLQLTLRAAAIARPQVVAGWDLAKRRPKPARRLAPAGTVFFVKLSGRDESIAEWVETTWMSCVSDEEQDRLDGFGLAVVGTWDGKLRRMEV
jgi:CRISPR-associated protein Cmr3